MKKRFKITFILALFTLLANKGYSQTSIAYYNSSESKIGLAYNFSEKLWGEARLAVTFEEFNTDLVMCYNALKINDYNIYLGVGAQINEEEAGIIVPIGVQFAPFEKFKELSLHVELQPLFTDYDTYLKSSIGIRYTFGKK